MKENSTSVFEKIERVGILPVVCPEDGFQLDVLLDAVRDTEVKVLEITLRNSFSTNAIKYIKENLPELSVGAGTVNTPSKLKEALSCGPDFLVAPGIAEFALDPQATKGIPFVHGVSTPSEILKLINLGHDVMKFFPAECSGGVNALKLYSGAFSGVKFLPTGGITADNLGEYLSCSNVLGCGGSFMVPKNLLAGGKSEEINALIKKLCRKEEKR